MTRPTQLLLLLVAAALLGLSACGGGGTASLQSEDIAVVGDQHITRAQFDEILKQAQSSYQQQKREFPKAGSPEYETLKNQIVAFLVQRAEFAQEADDFGIDVGDNKVNQRLTELKQQYFGGNQKRYESSIKAQGLTEAQVRDQIRTQLVSEALFKEVTDDVEISDEDLRKYYNSHKQQFTQPASREVRHILVKRKALADDLYAQLRDGAAFGALARRYSQDPGSKTQGGKLTVSKGQTVPPFDRAAFSLDANEVSRPIKTTYGWHIIEPLGAVKAAKVTPFAQAKSQIQGQLEQERKQEAMREWVDDTKKEYGDKIRYAAGFAPPATATGTGTTNS
jgi:parvulin-like peptidyl-prolyl isomerase